MFAEGIIEEQHHESGKRFRNYRDCPFSTSSGRVYNAVGEGDAEMDAATIYEKVLRTMNSTSGGKNQWKLISLVCFAEPDIDGGCFTERECGFLYQLAPNIQHAFEAADATFISAQDDLKRKIKQTT
jgi:hypothetical protein